MPPLGNYRQFQFHKGTIKTEVFDMMTTGESHFNSIKVRLKHKVLSALSSIFHLFQFHKGTIKTTSSSISQVSYFLFQFHKGTIKTKFPQKSFHSVLLFQFHKGTIKTAVIIFLCTKKLHFNSIKVRLKLSAE